MSEHVFRVRKYQQPLHKAWVSGKFDRLLEIAHRRWGKDEVALNAGRDLALQRPASYWHCLPEYGQGRKAIWTAVNPHTGKRRVDEAFPHEIVARRNEQEMFIELVNGSTWQVIGSDRFDATVGASPAGITYSEWALCNPAAWAYHRPMLEENKGWGAFITTPRGNNHAKSMLDMAKKNPRWFAEVSTVHDTRALTGEQIAEAKAEYDAIYGRDLGRAMFEQEYECSFSAAVVGAYYAREVAQAETDKRVTRVHRDKAADVIAAWDLGIGDSTAIWCFQLVGQEWHFLDYYEASGEALDHYVDYIKALPFTVHEHLLPHDAEQRELQTGKTRQDFLRARGLKTRIIPRHGADERINAARVRFDRMWFDEERCARGLEALRMYRAEWDDKRKTLKSRPLHDWTSHGADAFGYAVIGANERTTKPKRSAPRRAQEGGWMG